MLFYFNLEGGGKKRHLGNWGGVVLEVKGSVSFGIEKGWERCAPIEFSPERGNPRPFLSEKEEWRIAERTTSQGAYLEGKGGGTNL